MKSLSNTKQFWIFTLFTFSSIIFNAFLTTFEVPFLFVIPVALTVGFLAIQLESWIFQHKGIWSQNSTLLLIRSIIFGIFWPAFSQTINAGIGMIVACSVDQHACGGPPFFVKLFFAFTLLAFYSFPLGIIIGFIYRAIISSESKSRKIVC